MSPLESGLSMQPSNLSGGQQARVGIARGVLKVLKGGCEVLLLDEVTAHLDSQTEAKVLFSLKKLVKANGIACLLVTHRMQHASKVADRILVLKEGRLVEEGTHQNLMSNSGTYSTLVKLSM